VFVGDRNVNFAASKRVSVGGGKDQKAGPSSASRIRDQQGFGLEALKLRGQSSPDTDHAHLAVQCLGALSRLPRSRSEAGRKMGHRISRWTDLLKQVEQRRLAAKSASESLFKGKRFEERMPVEAFEDIAQAREPIFALKQCLISLDICAETPVDLLDRLASSIQAAALDPQDRSAAETARERIESWKKFVLDRKDSVEPTYWGHPVPALSALVPNSFSLSVAERANLKGLIDAFRERMTVRGVTFAQVSLDAFVPPPDPEPVPRHCLPSWSARVLPQPSAPEAPAHIGRANGPFENKSRSGSVEDADIAPATARSQRDSKPAAASAPLSKREIELEAVRRPLQRLKDLVKSDLSIASIVKAQAMLAKFARGENVDETFPVKLDDLVGARVSDDREGDIRREFRDCDFAFKTLRVSIRTERELRQQQELQQKHLTDAREALEALKGMLGDHEQFGPAQDAIDSVIAGRADARSPLDPQALVEDIVTRIRQQVRVFGVAISAASHLNKPKDVAAPSRAQPAQQPAQPAGHPVVREPVVAPRDSRHTIRIHGRSHAAPGDMGQRDPSADEGIRGGGGS
jgi:hypothetical protein